MKRTFIILFAVLLSCSEDEVKRAAPGKMLVVVDGEESVSIAISAIVRPATPAANPRASIEATFETATGNFLILLSASTQDVFKPIDVGEYTVEGEDIPLNRGIIYYSPGGVIENSFVSFHVGGEVAGKIVFTQVDTANKLISGTFECKAAHKDTGELVTISQGSFTHIPYSE
jgi:hypothetical protein